MELSVDKIYTYVLGDNTYIFSKATSSSHAYGWDLYVICTDLNKYMKNINPTNSTLEDVTHMLTDTHITMLQSDDRENRNLGYKILMNKLNTDGIIQE